MSSPKAKKKYDLVLYGATGFTGVLATKYLAATYGQKLGVKWAIAGRSAEKLKKLSAEHGGGCDFLVADAADEDAIIKMVKQTKVIASTAGPFARYGTLLLATCAKLGTDYCDITGETNWVREMIAKYDNVARATKARIVVHCGHDSIPWDLSAYLLASKLKKDTGEEVAKLDFYDDIKSAPSGGTLETAFGIMFGKENRGKFTEQKKLGFDALLLNASGGKSEYGLKARNVDLLKFSNKKALPHRSFFFMAPVNANAVKRSNALNKYGPSIKYVEGQSFTSRLGAILYVLSWAIYGVFVYIAPLRFLMRKFFLPKPGQGPSEEYMDSGHLNVLGVCTGTSGTTVKSMMSFSVDPGYKDTARMLVESALVLALEGEKVEGGGGVLTPGACQKDLLLERLKETGTVFKYF
mmetsp:Transcript_5113/g.10763  ORF Transcript_5113/g.10763 Transcript_5113/m.10763 type:complete len:409 (+) Transcript_5113:36-1262(+)